MNLTDVDAREEMDPDRPPADAELDSAEAANEGEDPRLKLAELGHDASLLEADPQLAEALLASAFLREEQAREDERKLKEAEDAKRKAEAEEKLKAQKKQELELLRKEGLAPKIDYHYLTVLYGIDGIERLADGSDGDQRLVRTLHKTLMSRLWDPAGGDA